MTTDLVIPADFAEALLLLREEGVLGPTFADFSKIVPPGDRGWDRYEQVGRVLGKAHDAIKWWLVDFLTYGEGAFSDRYAQAAEYLGLSERTLQDYHWVGQNVPRSRRREDLSFSHHRVVAKRKVTPEMQEALLAKAVSQRMTVRDLEDDVKQIAPARDGDEQPAWSADLMKRALDRRTVVEAAHNAVISARPSAGGWFVTNEAMARLRAAVGEEK